MGIFDYDGALMDALRKFSDIVLYNIIFCLFSLPVITAGASMMALCEGMRMIAQDEELPDGAFRTFIGSFRKNFKRGTLLWLAVLVVGGILFMASKGLLLMSEGIRTMYTIPFLVLVFIAVIGYQYYFPLASMYEDWDFRKVVKNSFLWVLAGFPQTMLTLLVTGVFAYVTLILNMNVMRFGIFVWCSCGFGIVTYLNALFFLRIQAKISGRSVV